MPLNETTFVNASHIVLKTIYVHIIILFLTVGK